MIDELFKELADIEQVEAIALGGSRSGENYDDKSDYDVYIYSDSFISDERRKSVLEKYCSYTEIGNYYWEYEDNCTLKNGIDIDIIYRDLDSAKERFSVPYPEKLKSNIIEKNFALLCTAMPAYSKQIQKACERHDRVSVLHRTTAFLESYFDILFALNSLTHPGEKRLIELCKQQCKVLPDGFEANLNKLFDDMIIRSEEIKKDIENIISELKKII